jgi:hypothetical protein
VPNHALWFVALEREDLIWKQHPFDFYTERKVVADAGAHPPSQYLNSLEDNLRRELHVERLTWADTGTAEKVANGIGHVTAGPH